MRMELDAAALDRLIGGDTEVEVRLRQRVVDEFFRKRIKSLLNSEVTSRLGAELDELVKGHVVAAIAELKANRDDYAAKAIADAFRWDLRSRFEQAAQQAIDSAIAKVIEYQRHRFASVINQAVERALAADIETRIDEGIKRRLDLARAAG